MISSWPPQTVAGRQGKEMGLFPVWVSEGITVGLLTLGASAALHAIAGTVLWTARWLGHHIWQATARKAQNG